MRRAEVYQQGKLAGILEQLEGARWRFSYARRLYRPTGFINDAGAEESL